MLVLNIMAKMEVCTVKLVDIVFSVINSPPNLELLQKKENDELGEEIKKAIAEMITQFRKIWRGDHTLRDQQELDKFIPLMKRRLVSKLSAGALSYFMANWATIRPILILYPESEKFVEVGDEFFL